MALGANLDGFAPVFAPDRILDAGRASALEFVVFLF